MTTHFYKLKTAVQNTSPASRLEGASVMQTLCAQNIKASDVFSVDVAMHTRAIERLRPIPELFSLAGKKNQRLVLLIMLNRLAVADNLA